MARIHSDYFSSCHCQTPNQKKRVEEGRRCFGSQFESSCRGGDGRSSQLSKPQEERKGNVCLTDFFLPGSLSLGSQPME